MWNGNLNNTEEVVLYINSELKKERSQKEIEIYDFKVNQGVIKNRLSRRGYKKINNQWVLQNNEYDESNTKVINIQKKEYEKSNIIVTDSKNTKESDSDKNNTSLIIDEKLKTNIINLAKNYNKIMSIVEGYDKEYDKKYDEIAIALPIETIKDFRTSIRVNNVVWEQFNKFVGEHKEFTKRDLLSMALKEYINKYK
ncbi:hypothetical protein FC778_15320 [Clostridium botulinum]|nr:hypothetical protein [Clostridium botulinum]